MILGGDPISKYPFALFGSQADELRQISWLSVSGYSVRLNRACVSREPDRGLVLLYCGCTTEPRGLCPCAYDPCCCHPVFPEKDDRDFGRMGCHIYGERRAYLDHYGSDATPSYVLSDLEMSRNQVGSCKLTKANTHLSRACQPFPNIDQQATFSMSDFYRTREVSYA